MFLKAISVVLLNIVHLGSRYKNRPHLRAINFLNLPILFVLVVFHARLNKNVHLLRDRHNSREIVISDHDDPKTGCLAHSYGDEHGPTRWAKKRRLTDERENLHQEVEFIGVQLKNPPGTRPEERSVWKPRERSPRDPSCTRAAYS